MHKPILRLLLTGAFFSLGQSQVGSYPLCADTCVQNALDGQSSCGFTTDFSCYCHEPESSQGLACVSSACDASDVQLYVQAKQQACAAFGGLVTSTGGTASSAPTATSAAATANGGDVFPTTFATQASVPQSTVVVSVPVSSQPQAARVNPGIIAGPTVGGVVLIALVVWVVLRRRRSQRASLAGAGAGVPIQNGGGDGVGADGGGHETQETGDTAGAQAILDTFRPAQLVPEGDNHGKPAAVQHAAEVSEDEGHWV